MSQDNVEQILQYAREQLHSLEHQLSSSFTKLLEQLNALVSVVSMWTYSLSDASDYSVLG